MSQYAPSNTWQLNPEWNLLFNSVLLPCWPRCCWFLRCLMIGQAFMCSLTVCFHSYRYGNTRNAGSEEFMQSLTPRVSGHNYTFIEYFKHLPHAAANPTQPNQIKLCHSNLFLLISNHQTTKSLDVISSSS